ncbi:unnamed protein product [Pseudo-nitzschia multistriata]|uniref:Uncharacterized protein n=1 Tax=Pseudo-nitzschia multistriata TaxID=183589 RepID=A0A448Z7C3_9STRA|nr:unnamed protein product [Pseudo-nitzschia multistriata]
MDTTIHLSRTVLFFSILFVFSLFTILLETKELALVRVRETSYANEIENIAIEYANEIENIANEHAKEIEKITNEHAKEIEKITIEKESKSVEPQTIEEQACLDLGDGNNMDELLSAHKQVFVAMPAKAAGSSMKSFTSKCMKRGWSGNYTDRWVENVLAKPDVLKELLHGPLEVPPLIASHMYEDADFMRLMQAATKETLIVYIHREETSRLTSAIRYVMDHRKCPEFLKEHRANNDKKTCTVEEEQLTQIIQDRKTNSMGEIEYGAVELLTCRTYSAIRSNAPKLVFMHYKQASKLQKLLAKRFCPRQGDSLKNVRSEDAKIQVELREGGSVVTLDQWLDAKQHFLELALGMKETMTCQHETKSMEETLFACPDETFYWTPEMNLVSR